MSDGWYSACLGEAESFLDRFQKQDRQVVRVDSDFTAALVGLLQAHAHMNKAMMHLAEAGMEFERLGQ